MKKLIGGFLILFLFAGFSANASEAGDLLIQVDLDSSSHEGCSILQVKPDGTLSEFVSGASVVAATGSSGCDFGDTGMAAGLNGLIYFSEDTSDNIMFAEANGEVSTFVTDTFLESLPSLPNSVDWENGMAINPATGTLVAADEGNEAIIEFPTNVPTPIQDPGLVTILANEADFGALIDINQVDLEGGIAIDLQENIYITNDGGNSVGNEVIFKLTSQGDLSILCTQAQLEAVPGVGPDINLDVGVAFDGNLYVGDDGDCDCILKVDPVTCDPQILITEDQINNITGNTTTDPEGGLCIDGNMNLYLGDDGSAPGDNERPNVVQIPTGNPATAFLFASAANVRNFYSDIDPGGDPQFEGSCTIKGGFQIPTLSEWGMIAMAAVLGLAGFMVARRRMVKA